ncbi:E4 SUMO-protein ligase PIAL2-like protein [Drosera capensis]
MAQFTAAAAAAATAGFNAGGAAIAADINSQRIYSCAERLSYCAQSHQPNPTSYFNLCLSLASAFDSALAADNVPKDAARLPRVIKQVCHHKNDFYRQAALMVLMLSVKVNALCGDYRVPSIMPYEGLFCFYSHSIKHNACKSGWFASNDAEDLYTLANEISSCFYPMGDIITEPTSFLPFVGVIMSRFYPQVKLGQLMLAFEIKPGYASYIEDFQIPKSIRYSRGEKMRLFVAQKENTDTSASIVHPPNVNFLVNGKGVEKRTNVMMDPGPQLPTIIESHIRYGTNLVQAVGQCDGNYIVLVAFMSTVPSSELPAVQDYVQSASTELDSDSEIIVGESRISLNCPISYTRIKTPVKGHMCRHHQCFDLSNYLEINSRRPSWRCPCCNQSVCYPEIRIDQNMVKILKELGEEVLDVIISADGSWKAAARTKDNKEPQDAIVNSPSERSRTEVDSGISPSNVCDLTKEDTEMVTADPCVQEESKPKFISLPQSQSMLIGLSAAPASAEINHGSVSQNDNVWSPILSSPFEPANSRPVSEHSTGVSQSPPMDILPPSIFVEPTPRSVSLLITNVSQPFSAKNGPQPVLTDAVSPASRREDEAFQVTNPYNSPILDQTPTVNGSQYQQSQYSQPMVRSEYGRSPAIPANVTRISTGMQTLPVHSPRSSPLPANVVNNTSGIGEMRQRHTSQGYNSRPPIPDMVNSFSARTLNVESAGVTAPVRSPSSAATQFPNSVAVPYRNSVGVQLPSTAPVPFPSPGYRFASGVRNVNQQQPLNLRTPQRVSMAPHLMRSSYFPQAQGPVGSSTFRTPHMAQHTQLLAAGQVSRSSPTVSLYNQALETMSPPTVPSSVPMNTERSRMVGGTSSGTVQTVTRNENLIDIQSEQGWRPPGRMRGSLIGRPYSEALSQFMIQPTEEPQASAPPSNLATPPHLQAPQPNPISSAQASQNLPTTTSS